MDTKWNNTDKSASMEGVPLKEGRPKGGRGKALIGFLAFFLGVSLTVSCLGNVGNRLVWERDISPRWTSDWQETDNFRQEVSSILRDFLTIGAGGKLDFYDYDYWHWTEHGELIDEAVIQATEGGWPWRMASYAVDRGTASYDSAPVVPDSQEPEVEREPDAAYQNDKNVLYHIESSGGKTYTNGGNTTGFMGQSIEGYNFYLTFRDGKVTICKDGQELNVYGDGIYDGDSQWFVPGYYNFPATDQLDDVTVLMAVRETPIRYYAVDYKTGNSYNSSSMYYIAQRVEESRVFYLTQAIVGGWGIILLLLWFFLRKFTEPVDRKIASWTVHVWTEGRFVLVLLCGLWTFLPGLSNTDIYWAWRYGYFWEYADSSFSDAASQLLRLLLVNIPGLLALVWLVWFIHNDHRYNRKEDRRSLLRPFLRALRARDLKRPVEKRVSRMAVLLSLAVLVLGGEILFFLILLTDTYMLPVWSLWTLFILPVLLAGLAASFLTSRQHHLAKDIARLADQVEAVRAGDLNKPLLLPEDADLRRTAESLNDIQAGMKAALEEQTRSERMKVELVSNVSHDLKTPLTSILSYAELLRQEEDLPPAAADYAQIIDEKAQRLKGMVEDVFEISKAAADQLPVHLERLDLGKLLRQTLADMDGPIQESALAFKVELPEEPVMITADGRRLYRVFQNLVDNALRYALEGSRVYLSLKTAEGTAEASVRNTSRNELPEGVDFTARFVRGDASRTDGGSGLGLSIAKSFTEACGGTFRVETVADLFTATATFPVIEY